MPLLRFHIAVLAFLCTFVTCALLCAAPAASVTPADTPVDVPADTLANVPDEEYPLPTRLAPIRKEPVSPAELKKNILDALVKLEADAQLEADAEARRAAERRERLDREQSQREQQAARERARIAQEKHQAKAKTIADAIKMAALPPPAVIPAKKDWPLPKLVEDPAWNSPATAIFFQNKYTLADLKAFYPKLLKEAINGNPRAMLVLSYAYRRWGIEISSTFSRLHPPMHSSDYWRRWAIQLTSPDWVDLRLGDISPDIDEKLTRYRAAAAYRNSEAMFHVAMMDDRPELLVEAAMGGHPEAASIVAFNMGVGTGGFPSSPRQAAAYWWRGALAGDARSMLVCSELFFQGQNGFPKDDRRSYMLALLAVEEAQKRGSPAAAILPTAQRHLAGLGAALGLNADAIWERREELQIFRAAPQEERLARLAAASPTRETVLYSLEAELGDLRLALGESAPTDYNFAASSDLEMILVDTQRQRENSYFIIFGIFGALTVLGGYFGMRIRFYYKIVRIVSVREGS